MKLSPLRIATFSTVLLSAACGAQPPKAVSATPAPAVAASSGRDPQIVQLAKPALECKFEDGYLDNDCVALRAWVDDETLFADGKGNATLWSMLGDPDVKVRALAAERSIDGAEAFFADKARATELFERASKETNAAAARALGQYVVRVDAKVHGLESQLLSLAKHPTATLRSALAFGLAPRQQSPAAIAAVKVLLEDSDKEVRSRALLSLSSGGVTPGVEPVCQLLTKQLSRQDNFAGDALWAASSSKCPNLHPLVLEELSKRIADPTTVTNANGIGYSLAASGVCSRTADVALKKKLFEVGRTLASAKIADPNTRRAALSVIVDCDAQGAEKLLQALATDKDKFVADSAKEKLARVKPKK